MEEALLVAEDGIHFKIISVISGQETNLEIVDLLQASNNLAVFQMDLTLNFNEKNQKSVFYDLFIF